MPEVRIATFNLENFDETDAAERPSLAERIQLMRPQILRLRADIVCFQEVNGQERPSQPRALLALTELLTGTALSGAHLVSTQTTNNEVNDERNLVVATMFPVIAVEQFRNDLVAQLSYRRLTAKPPDATAVTIDIERPILHVMIDLPDGEPLHVINVHLKSKIPTDIPGQKINAFTWRSADAWAEGSFLSSIKRMSQALEVRRLIDKILDADPTPESWPRATSTPPLTRSRSWPSVATSRTPATPTWSVGSWYPSSTPSPPLPDTPCSTKGTGEMLDHMLITRNLLAHYRGSEIHNEILHDESAAFADRPKISRVRPRPRRRDLRLLKVRPLRRIKDLPASGQQGELWWRERRLSCLAALCPQRSFTQTSDAIRPRGPGDRAAPGSRGVRDRRQQPGGRRGRPRGRRVVAAAHKALLAAAARWLPEPEPTSRVGQQRDPLPIGALGARRHHLNTPGSVADQLCRLLDDGPGIAARVGPWAYWVVRARAASRADRRVPRLHRDRCDRPLGTHCVGIRAALPGVCGSRWTCKTPWCIAGPVALMTLIDVIVGVDRDRRSLAKQR